VLPYDRFLNLVYYAIVRQLDLDARRDLDRLLAGPATPTQSSPAAAAVAARPATRGGKKVPPWWKGDDAAATASLQAARELRLVT
jgi:hypothetical protein